VFEALNMHAEPVRASPSFAQIPEKGSVQVVAHRLAPKLAAQTPSVLVVAPKPAAKKSREKKTDSKRTPPPPMPAPPSLPPNWLELSRVATPAPGAEEEFARESTAETKDKAESREKPPVMEDWTLVRTKDGNAGWVLSRMLQLAIPDDVAQYAEGHRITSYFPLADVQDGDQTKHYWLWTTMSHGGEPYEFDGFRVFVWSLKRHRYETAYIERKVKGYYPVEAKKGSGEKGEGASFSLILDQDGQVFRKTYLFNGYRVSLASKEPYQLAVDPSRNETVASAAPASVPPVPSSGPGLLARLKERIRTVFR
jgi:hypothetical protein